MLNGVALLIGLLLLIGFFLIIFIILYFERVNENYINKAKEDESNGGKFVAIVLTNKSQDDKFFVYSSGIMFLIKHLEKSKIPYKLLKKFDFDKFKEFIYDTNCRGLYIIGHGTRHSLSIGMGIFKKAEVVEYSLFKGFNGMPKDFVVQLHCNNDGGESLADIISPNKSLSFVSDSYRFNVDNLKYFICLDQKSPQKSISLAIVIFALTVYASILKPINAFLDSIRNLWKHYLGMKSFHP